MTALLRLIAKYAEVENATLVEAPLSRDYAFELKYDGYRMLAFKVEADVRLVSRRGQDWTQVFADIARAIAALDLHSVVLDGEVVAPDERGVPSFQRLQNRQRPLSYVAFDLLSLDGADLRPQPIEQRRGTLARILAGCQPPLLVATALTGDVDQLLTAACKAGFEGLIGKRVGSPYRPGRGLDWIKLKCHRRQEFALVGYLPLTGSQRGIVGSLILALHDEGRFVFAGKVGTGFDERTRSALGQLLEERHVEGPSASDVPRFGGLVRWAKPDLVAEIRFSEWTEAHHARHPTYLGLRPDKRPEDCVLERTSTQAPSRNSG